MSMDLMEEGLAEVDIFEDRKAIALDTIENKGETNARYRGDSKRSG